MAETVRKPKPIAGGLWGLSLGLGLGLLAINAKLIDFAIVPFVIVTVIGIAIGVLWGMFGPAKKPKGDPPSPSAFPASGTPEPPTAEPEPDSTTVDATGGTPDESTAAADSTALPGEPPESPTGRI